MNIHFFYIEKVHYHYLPHDTNLFILVCEFKKLVDVTPKNIVIKLLKNRCGSLTKKDITHLNFNLIKAPEDVIDYIIIHELCHLRVKGHSYQFWNYLKQFVPDYEMRIKYLERNSVNILS